MRRRYACSIFVSVLEFAGCGEDDDTQDPADASVHDAVSDAPPYRPVILPLHLGGGTVPGFAQRRNRPRFCAGVVTSRTVPFDGRRTLHEVNSDRLDELGRDHGLEAIRHTESEDVLGRSEVDWTTLVFESPDDGTASLPTLRNIIVNHDKFAT